MSTYVALIADCTGRYAHVYGNANNWVNFHDQLEDVGCEVIENQTTDYEDDLTPEALEENEVMSITHLLKHSDFVPCD